MVEHRDEIHTSFPRGPGERQPAASVRLKNDPGRHGMLTGRTRERRGIQLHQVKFIDGTVSFVPDDQLELIDDGPQDPLDLLQRGRLGRAADLRRAITHVRLTGRLADVIYSMDTTGTDFYAYQFKPVVKLLNSATTGMLIADEVGLGKTIEAGLVWTELRTRFDYRRILVLCPAVLREKWQRELRERFGVEAAILNAGDTLRQLRIAAEQGPHASFAIIASMQGHRPRKGWRRERPPQAGRASALARFLADEADEDPIIDLCVIDEAHYLRNPETMTSTLGELLRGVSHYMLLLSATPIHLKREDLFELAKLIDPYTFNHPATFQQILRANEPLVTLRERVVAGAVSGDSLRRDLEVICKHPLLKDNRQLASLRDESPTDHQLADPRFVSRLAYRIETANLIGHIVTRTRRREVTEWRTVRDVVARAIDLTPIERAFYDTVTEVVREYCGGRMAHEGFLLVTPQRQMSSSMPAALRYWQQRQEADPEELYEDFGIDRSSNETDSSSVDDTPLLQELVSRTDELGDLYELWTHDSKYKELLSLLQQLFHDSAGSDKVVVFSYFRATLSYLSERLARDGISCHELKGGISNKDEVIDAFREAAGPTVLLSSEVGSEGIDLQFSSVVINYDLPWNPMKVEQRIGRIDRLGQRESKILVRNLICKGTIDARIYHRLFQRLNIFHETLGALEPVLGEQIHDLTMGLMSKQLTPEEEDARIEQTRRALANIRQEEEELEKSASHLIAYGDYILNQVRAARELKRQIEGKDIQSYVLDFFKLRYKGSEFRQVEAESPEFDVKLSTQAKHELDKYVRDERLEGATQLMRSNVRVVRCRFENSTVPSKGMRTEVISQFHPLVRFVGRQISTVEHYFHPAVAIRVPAEDVPEEIAAGVYVFSVQRWSLSALQDIERLYFAAATLQKPHHVMHSDLAEQLVMRAADGGHDWPDVEDRVDVAAASSVANEVCLGRSDEAFETFVREARAQNDDRADVQLRTLDSHYEQQMKTLREVREGHVGARRDNLVRATEGKMQSLTDRVERRRIAIAERRRVASSRDEICVGIIEVTAATGEEKSDAVA